MTALLLCLVAELIEHNARADLLSVHHNYTVALLSTLQHVDVGKQCVKEQFVPKTSTIICSNIVALQLLLII